jgi:hypothetical protein
MALNILCGYLFLILHILYFQHVYVSLLRVWRKIFGAKRKEEAVGWVKLYKEEVNFLCFVVYNVGW